MLQNKPKKFSRRLQKIFLVKAYCLVIKKFLQKKNKSER